MRTTPPAIETLLSLIYLCSFITKEEMTTVKTVCVKLINVDWFGIL